MAFDGMTRYRLNRPVSDDENAARLSIGQSVSDSPKDSRSVFSMNETFLEVCDGNYSEKGWGVVAFTLPGIVSLAGVVLLLWMMTHIPPIYEQRGQLGLIRGVLGVFLIVMLWFLGIGLWALSRDCFTYTHKPVRLNRRDRMIYAFKHNGTGGVVSVPWDSAFLYVERRPKAGITRTAPRMVRCLVLDEKGRVKDTFSLGRRFVTAFDEGSTGDLEVTNALNANFEYIRRFMEGGPSVVPAASEFLPTDVSLRNMLKEQFDGASDLLNSPNPMLKYFMFGAAIPTFFLALAGYLAQLTCRKPVWPDEVERACNPVNANAERFAT